MPEINKVIRSKNIKQVSRIEELKPATEKPITKVIPKVQNKTQIKTEIEEAIVDQPLDLPFEAAKQASISAIRHANNLSSSSDKTEDQEAIRFCNKGFH